LTYIRTGIRTNHELRRRMETEQLFLAGRKQTGKLDFAACAALVALIATVFAPAIGYGFVNWDDPWYVLKNPLLDSWSPANLWEIATRPIVRNYAPLTMFGLLIQHSLWGLWAGGYHLTNIVLHAVNAALVYVLIRQLSGRRPLAWMTAALFALHPVQVETVAWVSSFKGLLSATFILVSLICWLRPEPTGRHEGFGILFHLLGLLSKAVGITVPAIVFGYDVLIARKRVPAAIARQIVPVVLGVLILKVTMSAQMAELGGVRDHLAWSKTRIAAVDTVLLWKYLGLLFWPRDLCVLYDPITRGIAAAVVVAACGWLAVGLWAIALRRRFPFVLLGLTGFLALLFPALNFFPITTLLNDRYLYLPSIPVFALVAVGIAWLAERGRIRLPEIAFSYSPLPPGAGPGVWAARDLRRAAEAGGSILSATLVPKLLLGKALGGSSASLGAAAEAELRAIVFPSGSLGTRSNLTLDRPADRMVGCVLTRSIAAACFAILLVGYMTATRERLTVWQDDQTLWYDAMAKSPGLTVVRFQWATALHHQRRDSEAVAVLERALLETNPDDADRSRIHAAIAEWKRAL
jgi:protein O-mannosyl-transferase